jgi:hypothetical protein
VNRSKIGKQNLDALSDQLIAGVAELPLDRGVDQHDGSSRTRDEHAARRRFDGELE